MLDKLSPGIIELMPLNESPAEQSAAWYQPSDTPSVPFSPQGGQNHITSWLCRPASEMHQGWPQPHSRLAWYCNDVLDVGLSGLNYCLNMHPKEILKKYTRSSPHPPPLTPPPPLFSQWVLQNHFVLLGSVLHITRQHICQQILLTF